VGQEDIWLVADSFIQLTNYKRLKYCTHLYKYGPFKFWSL